MGELEKYGQIQLAVKDVRKKLPKSMPDDYRPMETM